MTTRHRLRISSPSAAPRGKFRGKRRYFRALRRDADAFQLECPPDHWWNFWHHHVDWRGWGNLSWRYRVEHLRALRRVFATCAASLETYPHPFQLWLHLDFEDAAQDAVYVHSLNPYETEFPHTRDELEWGDPELAQLLAPFEARAGSIEYEGGVTAVLYVPGIGVPIEPHE